MKTTKGSLRLRKFTRLNVEFFMKRPEISGLENLTNLPKNKGIVIAATHLTDADIQAIISVVAKHRKAGLAILDAHLRIPIYGHVLRFMTGNNLHGVSGSFGRFRLENADVKYKFDPVDYQKMKVALDRGSAVVIAAHQPTYNWQLPDKPGLGAVFLAQLQDAPLILPAVFNIDNKSPGIKPAVFADMFGAFKRLLTGSRPGSQMFFGTPIQLEKINTADIDFVVSYYQKRSNSAHLFSLEEREIIKSTLHKIEAQGKILMKALASLLPLEKRGHW